VRGAPVIIYGEKEGRQLRETGGGGLGMGRAREGLLRKERK